MFSIHFWRHVRIALTEIWKSALTRFTRKLISSMWDWIYLLSFQMKVGISHEHILSPKFFPLFIKFLIILYLKDERERQKIVKRTAEHIQQHNFLWLSKRSKISNLTNLELWSHFKYLTLGLKMYILRNILIFQKLCCFLGTNFPFSPPELGFNHQ